MALRLLCSTQQTLLLHKPSNPPFPSSSSSISLPSIKHFTPTRTKPNQLIFQLSSTTEQHSTTPTTTTDSLQQEPRTRLIAQNIPWSATSQDVLNLFQTHGNVIEVELSMFGKTRNRGLAFITMGSEQEALEALTKLDSYEMEGRSITVAYAKPKKRKEPVLPAPSVPTYDVFVANLSWKVKSKDLEEFFSSMRGDVVSAEVTYQMSPTRKPTGYGFVSFRSKEKAEEAISTFQGKELMAKPVRLAFSNRSLQAESKDGSNDGKTSKETNDDKGKLDSADKN